MVFFPPPTLGVQFPEAQQVYQNHCCPFVALRAQKPDLVPDLILPGGLRRACPACLQHLVDFSCSWMSVINIVKDFPVLMRGLLLTGMICIVCVLELERHSYGGSRRRIVFFFISFHPFVMSLEL